MSEERSILDPFGAINVISRSSVYVWVMFIVTETKSAVVKPLDYIILDVVVERSEMA